MAFEFETNVEDCVVLVTDRKHPRFGQVGALEWHDWNEYGVYCVRFADGKEEQFRDGMCKGDPPSPVKTFYRHKSEKGQFMDSMYDWGLENFKKTFLELGIGTLEELTKKYSEVFREELKV